VAPVVIIYLIWGAWLLLWFAAGIVGPREAGAPRGWRAILFHLATVPAFALLLTLVRPFPATDLADGLWTAGIPDGPGWALVLLTLAGFALAAWTCSHRIRRATAGVQLVDSGPYALVRHPYHLGVLIAATATAVLFGQLTALLGLLLLAGILIAKISYEEQACDDDAYRTYRAHTPLIVPFWPENIHVPRGGRLAK